MLTLRRRNVIPAKAGFLPQEPSPIQGAGGNIAKRPPSTLTPSPSTGEGWGEGDSPMVGADPRVRPLRATYITPSKGEAGTTASPSTLTPSPSTGEGWGEGDSPMVGADPRVRPLRATYITPSKGEGGTTTPQEATR